MYPKWLYIFNHWLWVAALGFILLLIAFTLLVFLPFNKFFSYEFICWLADDFIGWAVAGALAAFWTGTSVCMQYLREESQRLKAEEKKKEQEQK